MAYIRRKRLRDIKKNDNVILENDYVGERTMTWNSNPSWCPRMKESNRTPRRTGSTSVTDCNLHSYTKKGEPQRTGNNHHALMGGSSEAAARR